MKSRKEEFEKFLSINRNVIDNCQKEEIKRYKKLNKRFIIELILLIIIMFVFLYLVHIYNVGVYYEISIIVLSVFLILGLYIINRRLLSKEKKISCYVLNALIYEMILTFLSNGDYYFKLDTEIAESDFNKMKLFNMNYLKYTGSNLTAATYQNKKLIMCDVWLYDLIERIKTDSYYSKYDNTLYITNYHYHDRIDIFKGLYYETTINRDNNKYIYMIPNNLNDKFIQKNIYHYISYSGTKIELENLDFSERYSVFSFDEIKSRYILSLTLMEKINRLDKLITNKKYFVFKPDGRVGIFIDGFQLDNIFNRKFNINKKISKEHIYNIYITVNKLFDISQVLEDFNPYS